MREGRAEGRDPLAATLSFPANHKPNDSRVAATIPSFLLTPSLPDVVCHSVDVLLWPLLVSRHLITSSLFVCG